MALFRLMYRSSPPPGLSESALTDLVHDIRLQCLARNSAAELTGILAYSTLAFIQGLEGDESVVSELYQRIQADRRHSDVITISARVVMGRAFPDWSMAFAPMSPPVQLQDMTPKDVLRFLIDAQQFCQGVRTLPGRGLPPEARMRTDLGITEMKRH